LNRVADVEAGDVNVAVRHQAVPALVGIQRHDLVLVPRAVQRRPAVRGEQLLTELEGRCHVGQLHLADLDTRLGAFVTGRHLPSMHSLESEGYTTDSRFRGSGWTDAVVWVREQAMGRADEHLHPQGQSVFVEVEGRVMVGRCDGLNRVELLRLV
jgi:hypothetical protein